MKNAKHSILLSALMLVAMMGMTACEKAVLEEEEKTAEEVQTKCNVIIRTSMYNIVPFDTRAVQSVADFSNTLQFILYQDGTKVKSVTQKKSEGSYGQIALTLQPGTYQLLVLAHSSTDNPTVSDPTAIHFTNSDGYSDTFCYYGDIEVTLEQNTYDVLLQRATSMVRVTIVDEIPSNVTKIRLYYEGGSGVLNATTGMGGTVKSQQAITYNVVGYTAPLALKAYTFLKNEEGTLNMTVTAYAANDVIVAEKSLTNIPMKHRMVTEYSGYLFSTPQVNVDASFNLTAETEWSVFQQLTF
ncbi:MAG: FimB/Mfa2 family fimbrial subunit [Prevotella sp.]|nr:FimB/Mfa2 family fimbrial subunit [Prevotella sp.]